MKIFLILSCNLSNIYLIKYGFAHLVLLNCKFRHNKCCLLTIRILSNLPQSPGNGISETLNLKISSCLWPSFSPPQSKRASYGTVTLLLTDFTRPQGSSARHFPIVLGNVWATFSVWSNFFRLEQLQATLSFLSNFLLHS